jgi:hypothetical protein
MQALLAISALLLVLSGLSASLTSSANVGAPAPGGVPPVSAKAELGAEDYAVIGERNLFQIVRAVAPEPPPQIELEETRLDVELLATITAAEAPAGEVGDAAAAERVAVALLRDTNGANQALRIGGLLAEGRATVVEIRSGDVVIEHEGKLEVLKIAEDTVVPEPRSSRGRAARSARPGQRAADASRSVQRRGQNLDPLLASQLGPLLLDLGVRAGDRIVAIDGADIEDEPNPLGMLLDPGAPAEDRLVTLEAQDGSTREIVAPADIRERVEAALTGQQAR